MRWWGVHKLGIGERGHWHVGAMRLFVERREGEWRVAYRSSGDPFEEAAVVEVPSSRDLPLDEDLEQQRFGVRTTDESLLLTPVLPDRPVVSQPDTPFHILAEEEVRVYVSLPVWVRLETGTSPRPLLEVPLYRTSDTWFGPNTREGDYCYATKTRCRLDPADQHPRPQRAQAAVSIRNKTDHTVRVERLNIPVPHLGLFAAGDNALWTQAVTLTIEEAGTTAAIEIERQPPPEARSASLVSGARDPQGGNILTRAIGALIG